VLTVLLTRHGHTDKSEPEQYLGVRVDASLTDRGRGEAEALAKRLEGVRVDRIISSPLRRAVETARIVGRGAKVETDGRLIELDYGVWEGLTIEEIERRFPGEYEVYDANPALHHVGGGESGEEVAARLAPLIDDVLDWWEKSSVERTCVLVGHSSVNRVFLAVALGVPLVDYRRRFRQDWANLTILQWPSRDAGPELVLANDLAHIRGVHGVTWD
jgi:broad specificity phosphatase PhoE